MARTFQIRLTFILFFLLSTSSTSFALTRGQLESRLRQLIPDELTNQAHPDSTLDSLINTALSTVTSACSCKTDSFRIALDTTKRFYALPSDFENIKSVWDSASGKALTQIVSEDMGQFNLQIGSDTVPPYFFIEGKKSAKTIGFDYRPRKTNVIKGWYYSSAKLLTTDATTTDLPEAFDNAILYYTLSLVFFRDSEDARAIMFKAVAENEMAMAKQKFKIPDRIVLPKGVPQ